MRGAGEDAEGVDVADGGSVGMEVAVADGAVVFRWSGAVPGALRTLDGATEPLPPPPATLLLPAREPLLLLSWLRAALAVTFAFVSFEREFGADCWNAKLFTAPLCDCDVYFGEFPALRS